MKNEEWFFKLIFISDVSMRTWLANAEQEQFQHPTIVYIYIHFLHVDQHINSSLVKPDRVHDDASKRHLTNTFHTILSTISSLSMGEFVEKKRKKYQRKPERLLFSIGVVFCSDDCGNTITEEHRFWDWSVHHHLGIGRFTLSRRRQRLQQPRSRTV